MTKSVDVIVIGAGTNGLSAAATLAARGKQVLVLEAAGAVGGAGRLTEFAPGFHSSPAVFDTGWVPPAVAGATGVSAPATQQRAFDTSIVNGREIFSLSSDPRAAATSIRNMSAQDADKWQDFTAQMRSHAALLEQLYELPAPELDASELGQVVPLLGIAAGLRMSGRTRITDMLRVLPMSISDLCEDWFSNEILRAAVAAGGVNGIQQGPRSGGTAFVLLHHLTGGRTGNIRSRPVFSESPDAFTTALDHKLSARGVTVRTGSRIERIVVRDDAVTGVVLASGEELSCGAVLSAASPVTTLRDMVDPAWLDPELLHALDHIKLRGCTTHIHYALESLPRFAREHSDAARSTISLSASVNALERAADQSKYGQVMNPPHIEVTFPSLNWTQLAPAGKHVMSVKAHFTPRALRDDDWTAETAAEIATVVEAALERAMPGVTESTIARNISTPADIEAQCLAPGGALSHGEMTLDQILFMRPLPSLAQYATPIRGLFLGGAGSHPGPGVLGAAGVLAARRLLRSQD